MGLFADNYPDVPYETKLRLWEEVKADARFPSYMYGCYECGICVAACPSARIGGAAFNDMALSADAVIAF